MAETTYDLVLQPSRIAYISKCSPEFPFVHCRLALLNSKKAIEGRDVVKKDAALRVLYESKGLGVEGVYDISYQEPSADLGAEEKKKWKKWSENRY